jgi:hypothetical protein
MTVTNFTCVPWLLSWALRRAVGLCTSERGFPSFPGLLEHHMQLAMLFYADTSASGVGSLLDSHILAAGGFGLPFRHSGFFDQVVGVCWGSFVLAGVSVVMSPIPGLGRR